MMMIVAVRANPDISELPEKAQEALSRIKFQFPEPMLPNTKVVANKKLILVASDALPEDVATLDYEDEPETQGNGNGNGNGNGSGNGNQGGNPNRRSLEFEVLAREDEVVDQSLLLPYFEDEPVFEIDEDGDLVQTGTQPITDLTGRLQTWLGREWKYS